MGASAGALDALLQILPALPGDYPLPTVLVVHLPPDRDSALVNVLASRCALRVKEAEDKEDLSGGTVYVAPPDYHVLVEPELRLSLSSDEPVLYSRPSIDVLFESAADAYGSDLIAVVLSGANQDGARGLRAVCDNGGLGLVQDPKTADASAMPQAAIAACPQAMVLSAAEIAQKLASFVHAN